MRLRWATARAYELLVVQRLPVLQGVDEAGALRVRLWRCRLQGGRRPPIIACRDDRL